ncbi:MAG: hypothetical protein ISR47_00710 [Rhodospirillales bacterium]|nr:hypothetical protein [Rhodospirillales bacterium]
MRIAGIVIVFFSVVFFFSLHLTESKAGKENLGNQHVRFSSFMVPGGKDRWQRVNVPITPVFVVSKDTDVKRFCRMSPRILDAIVRDLYEKRKIKGKGQAINLTDFGMRLTSVVNVALGKDVVLETHVFDGVLNDGLEEANAAQWEKCKGVRL